MCGIFGILNRNKAVDAALLQKGIKQLYHRGPDSSDVWMEDNIGLAHSRLSIHDLSTHASQPMASSDGRYIVAFNGEIYNYRALRQRLQVDHGVSFKTDSDTEVLVNAIAQWGLLPTLKELVGMFAFAVWDRQVKRLTLARDRFGEKPLYYGTLGHEFVFASELKSIIAPFKSQLTIDRCALSTFLRFGYVPAPHTIYACLRKLEPGQYLEVTQAGKVSPHVYWSALDTARRARAAPLQGSLNEHVDQLDQRLKETIADQMLADVPVGAFLSGGVDSSVVTAVMQSLSVQKVKTFSIGFQEKAYSEAHHARAVAKHLGTEHTELYLSQQQAMNIVPRLPSVYDEPFADVSQIPTFLVSQLAKQSVTVSLSGDGGDELFGGYERYFLTQQVKTRFIDNRLLSFAIRHSPDFLQKWISLLPFEAAKKLQRRIAKLREVMASPDGGLGNLYLHSISQYWQPDSLLTEGAEYAPFHEMGLTSLSKQVNAQEWMMLNDTMLYLPGDILTKVDRAAMAVSLETRVPLLDHRLFEWVWQLPFHQKINGTCGKAVLKELLYRYVPKALVDRPKMGFGVPIRQWLKGGLKEWADALLSRQALQQGGFFQVDKVHTMWREHQSGQANWDKTLWCVLMFQAWYEQWHTR